MKLKIGGKERDLEFGKMGFLKHLGELSKKDPFDLFSDSFSADFEKIYKVNLNIIKAGLLTACDVKGEQPDFIDEDVDRWVSCLDMSEILGLPFEAIANLTGKSVDELKKVQTQVEPATEGA